MVRREGRRVSCAGVWQVPLSKRPRFGARLIVVAADAIVRLFHRGP
jgi:hypothetical protein